MNRIKTGVIGVGVMGQHHARVYSELGTCELMGVADINPERTREIGDRYKTPYYLDYRELIGKVDAVSIAVPTTQHYKVALDCLKAGKHCLVEKPIASRVDEADEMIQAAEKNRVILAVGHIEQFNPAVTKLKQIIDAGLLGEITSISTKRVGPLEPRIKDVGVVIDSATHDIGVVRYLLGKEPLNIFSRVGGLTHPEGDHALIVLDFGEATACLEVNWLTPNKVRTLTATGSEGIAYLDYIEQKLTLCNSRADKTALPDAKSEPNYSEEMPINKTEPLKLEIENFLMSIETGHKVLVDGREGKEILKIATTTDWKKI